MILPFLYKYTDVAGAKIILSSKNLKFSRSTSFNDPFDMQTHELLGDDLETFLERQKSALQDFLSTEIDYSTLKSGRLKESVIAINHYLKNASPAEKERLNSELKNTPIEEIYNLAELKNNSAILLEKIQSEMDACGVFCVSLKNDNSLMWSHYADHHRGCVLKFFPNVEKDSMLLAARPVTYSNTRPLLFRTPEDMVESGLTRSLGDSATKIWDDLIFTKSVDWSYEQEYRLAIPNLLTEKQDYQTLSFYSSELSGIYLGCRMPKEDKEIIVQLAKRINPSVEAYNTHTSTREYALYFTPYE